MDLKLSAAERQKLEALGGATFVRTVLAGYPDLRDDPRWPRTKIKPIEPVDDPAAILLELVDAERKLLQAVSGTFAADSADKRYVRTWERAARYVDGAAAMG